MSVPPPLTGEARERLVQALGRVASFMERLRPELGDWMACGEGCDGCCRQILSLRGVEAAYLLEGARALSAEAVSLVWGALSDPVRVPACPLLHGGVCVVYDHRPVLCRTHGLPMVRHEAGGAVLHHCPENFRDTDPSRLPPSLVLDEGRLAVLMDAVDALYGRETGWHGGRIAVDELLRAGLQG